MSKEKLIKILTDVINIEYEKITAVLGGSFSIDSKYYAKFMKDGRCVIVEIGEQLFPPRGNGSPNDLFTNICKFAKWKWVVKDHFVKEWPENAIDQQTGDVIKNLVITLFHLMYHSFIQRMNLN